MISTPDRIIPRLTYLGACSVTEWVASEFRIIRSPPQYRRKLDVMLEYLKTKGPSQDCNILSQVWNFVYLDRELVMNRTVFFLHTCGYAKFMAIW